MLTVGKDTYVTIEEATEYIQSHYSANNILRAHWECAPDEYKEQYLRQSLEEIEALPFIGRKSLHTNELQFPRILTGTPYCITHHPVYRLYYGDDTTVPEQVKEAQIENAVGVIRKTYKLQQSALILQKLGLAPQTEEAAGKLSSKRAERLLSPFLGSLKV